MLLKQRTYFQNPCSPLFRLPSRRAVRPTTRVPVNTSAEARRSAAPGASVGRVELPQPCYHVGEVGCSCHGLPGRRPGVKTSAHKVHVGGLNRHEPDWWRWLMQKSPILEIASPLLKRAAVCVLCLMLSRIGHVILLPGLDFKVVGSAIASGAEHKLLQDDLMGDLMGYASPLGIYHLGIGPYINASWFLSGVMLLKFPYSWYRHMNGLRRSGREGVSALKVYTQIGALIFAFLAGAQRAIELQPWAGSRPLFVTATTLELVAGAMVLRWAVDQNELAGLGDGVTLLICAGFGSRYASLLEGLPAKLAAAQVPIWKLGLAGTGCGALVYAATYITRVEKRLPLVYYKRRLQARQQESTSKALPPEPQRAPDYIPLRVTPGGTGSLLIAPFVFILLPAFVGRFSPAAASALGNLMITPSVKPWAFGAVVLLTCFLDLSGGSAAKDFSEWLASVDAGVKGISPGPFTEEYLTREQGTLRLLGALCLAGLAIAAQFFDAACRRQIGLSLDSLSLILMSGFITTAHRQAQALLRIPRLSRALAQERELLKLSSMGAG